MFACDNSRRRSRRPAATQIDTCAGFPCRHRPLEGERPRDLDALDRRHPGSAGPGEHYVNWFNRVARSYEVIQQVPLIPETLTRYYVNSAAGQPVPLSNLVTLKTPIGGGEAVIGSNVKVAAAGASLDVPLGQGRFPVIPAFRHDHDLSSRRTSTRRDPGRVGDR
jgi:hypothetical protein